MKDAERSFIKNRISKFVYPIGEDEEAYNRRRFERGRQLGKDIKGAILFDQSMMRLESDLKGLK